MTMQPRLRRVGLEFSSNPIPPLLPLHLRLLHCRRQVPLLARRRRMQLVMATQAMITAVGDCRPVQKAVLVPA